MFAANPKLINVLWLIIMLLQFIKLELVVSMKFDHLLIHSAMVTLKKQFIFI